MIILRKILIYNSLIFYKIKNIDFYKFKFLNLTVNYNYLNKMNITEQKIVIQQRIKKDQQEQVLGV